jgi:hypothetical protein
MFLAQKLKKFLKNAFFFFLAYFFDPLGQF